MASRLTDHERYLRTYTEAQVQGTVTDLFETLDWQWHHETDSRKSPEGWPDLFAVNHRTQWWVLLEVKKQTGKLSPSQEKWLNRAVGLPVFPGTSLIRMDGQRKLIGWVRPSTLDEWLETIREVSR